MHRGLIFAHVTDDQMEKFMAITGTHETGVYLRTSSWQHFKNSCVWLVLLAALGLISGYIVQSFEGLLLQFAILATFMRMLADTGRNTGSQSGTLVVRGHAVAAALGRIHTRYYDKVCRWKQTVETIRTCMPSSRHLNARSVDKKLRSAFSARYWLAAKWEVWQHETMV